MYVTQPDEFSERWAPYVVALLRIVTALLFLEHGTAKLLGFPETAMANPAVWSLPWIAGWFELIGGLLLLIGLFSRPVAFVLSGEMAVAYFQFHAPASFWPVVNQGIAAVLYCFIWLYFSAAGPGPWSLDALRRK